MPRTPKPYRVHAIDSPRGQALLTRHHVAGAVLALAVANYQGIERRRIGPLIGVNEDGLIGAEREGWRPDQADAFTGPLVIVPWVQVALARDAVADPRTCDLAYPAPATKPH